MTKSENLTIKNSEKLGLISNLATMLAAGIPILETIDSMLEDAKGNQKKVLTMLRQDIVSGTQVHASFARFPHIFNKVTVSIIKAAEEAGTLDTTLKDLKKQIQKEMEFSDKIRSALTYPFVILVVFVGVLLMMLVVVVPKISTVFVRLRVPLPLPTQIMIFTSDLMLKNTIPFILGLVAIIAAFWFLYKKNKYVILNILFALPVVSDLVKEIDLTRFTRSLSLLLGSGITIISALELTQDVVMRKDLQALILKSKNMILTGKRFSEGMKDNHGLIPSIVIKIIEAGEKTGSLDRSMQETSEYLDYQVTNTLMTLTALLEPVMLVFIGVLVGGMMLAIIAPMYGLIGQVGAR